MTFTELTNRMAHHIPKRSKKLIEDLTNDLDPFIQFCVDTKEEKIRELLESLLRMFKGHEAEALYNENVIKLIDDLATGINQARLTDAEPTYYFHKIDIYRSSDERQLAIILDSKLLKNILLVVMNTQNSYELFKRYDETFRIKDLIKNDTTVTICGAVHATKLIRHGYPENRIICVDFCIAKKEPYLKVIQLPCSISEFTGLLPEA